MEGEKDRERERDEKLSSDFWMWLLSLPSLILPLLELHF